MKPHLTIDLMKNAAVQFCQIMSAQAHPPLAGITDGKAVGTYIEKRFQEYLTERFECTIGGSGLGLDLPDEDINTDIKVTSFQQPQSSCPFRNARQKIYGLGYNLLIFVYEKKDVSPEGSSMNFTHCVFISRELTADYTTTKYLIQLLKDNANREDILAYLSDRNLPADDIVLNELADEILSHPPVQGYLTISNALQWRLQYGRLLELRNEVPGIWNL